MSALLYLRIKNNEKIVVWPKSLIFQSFLDWQAWAFFRKLDRRTVLGITIAYKVFFCKLYSVKMVFYRKWWGWLGWIGYDFIQILTKCLFLWKKFQQQQSLRTYLFYGKACWSNYRKIVAIVESLTFIIISHRSLILTASFSIDCIVL